MVEQHTPETPDGAETILLVEDEPMLLELVQSLLESTGYRVLTARDGRTAVETYKIHQQEIRLVLSDLGLPLLSGWEACRQMLAINPELKVVVATGYLDHSAKDEMMEGGVKEFVQKPYFAAELTAKLRELLDGKQ
ncbi:MAG: response regulator [Bacteroidetes bacterium]|nr:response regulator [Bacteroidota bacterium]MCW5895010.1 response regulator [Bacteroidota bacterium]